jgi:lipopolysaccharide/colanic/teichoic acid biosynthesis glycosyltransferase
MNKQDRSTHYSPYLNSRIKLCFDIAVCLMIIAPTIVILTILTITTFIIEGRPVFFIQKRTGKDDIPFLMPKIRTLSINADPNIPLHQSNIESYVTKTGRFVRKHRLDELPQIFCVLAGTMSMVGPRPELPVITAQYLPVHQKRLIAKPGITGLWQIKASRNLPIHENIEYDLCYLRNATLWLDIKILLKTVPFALVPAPLQNYENCLYTYNVPMPE